MIYNTLHLFQIAGFNFNLQIQIIVFQIFFGGIDCLFNATSEIDMIILQHHHVEQAEAMVGAAAELNRVFLEDTHVRGGLAGIQNTGFCTLYHVGVCSSGGGDAAHALHEIQQGTFGGQHLL